MFVFRIICALLLLSTSCIYAQINTLTNAAHNLDRRGLSLSLDASIDAFLGRDLGHAAQTVPAFIDLGTTALLDRFLPALKGTVAFASLHLNQSATDGFSSLLQPVSSLQADSGVFLAELWFEQAIRPAIHVRAGKLDANRDFAYVENGVSFLNAAAGYTPSFITLPNYNDTRPGVELLIHPNKFHLNFAAFAPIEGTGLLLMQEAGTGWNPQGWNGRLSAGFWRMTGSMPTLDGLDRKGSDGVYVVAEQKFWRHMRNGGAEEQSLAAYLQWGKSERNFSSMPQQTAIGLLWSAPFRSRTGDSAGFSCSRGDTLDYTGKEVVWESFYRLRTSKTLAFTPDFQYIAESPGYRGPTYAVGARIAISLRSGAE
ncbi:MAG TPA: carbohydrate porin [Terriglobales bacterium]|nr:carbohydrate porin [Terriglobales bacterium]